MQNYFEIPEIAFNIKNLQEVYKHNVNEWASYGVYKNNSLHTQYVSMDNTVIKTILNQFKDYSIIENIKFFKTLAKGEIHSHTDKRKVAINIPVIVDTFEPVVPAASGEPNGSLFESNGCGPALYDTVLVQLFAPA